MEKRIFINRLMGWSLMEVLVSLLILSFLLLGFDAMEFYSLQQNRKAYFFSVAENQLIALAEKIRAHNNFENQISDWNHQNNVVLPQGKGSVIGNFPDYIITLNWGSKEKNNLSMRVQL